MYRDLHRLDFAVHRHEMGHPPPRWQTSIIQCSREHRDNTTKLWKRMLVRYAGYLLSLFTMNQERALCQQYESNGQRRRTFRTCINNSITKHQPTPLADEISGAKRFFNVRVNVSAFWADQANGQILFGKFHFDYFFISVRVCEREGLGDAHTGNSMMWLWVKFRVCPSSHSGRIFCSLTHSIPQVYSNRQIPTKQP